MGRESIKKAVEDCCRISTNFLNKHEYFCGYASGNISWKYVVAEKDPNVGVYVSVEDWTGIIRFQYTYTDRFFSGEVEEYDYKVRLVATACHFGGKRWWFICPLEKNGIPCQKRVGVLYLGGRYFGCRHCYDLVYQSSKDSHKFDQLFRQMGLDPKTANKMLKEGRLL